MNTNVAVLKQPIYKTEYSNYGARHQKLMCTLATIAEISLKDNKLNKIVWVESEERFATLEFAGESTYEDYMAILTFLGNEGYKVKGLDIITEVEEDQESDFFSLKCKTGAIEVRHSGIETYGAFDNVRLNLVDSLPYVMNTPVETNCNNSKELQRILIKEMSFSRVIDCYLKGAGIYEPNIGLMIGTKWNCIISDGVIYVFCEKKSVETLTGEIITRLKKHDVKGTKRCGLVQL